MSKKLDAMNGEPKEAKVKMGFSVQITMHHQESARELTPEQIGFIVGEALEKNHTWNDLPEDLQEGVDFDLDVKRTYEQV